MSMYDWFPTVIAFSNTESRHEGKKKSVKLQTLPDDGSMDSSGEASQAEFQGELAKALVLPLVGGE